MTSGDECQTRTANQKSAHLMPSPYPPSCSAQLGCITAEVPGSSYRISNYTKPISILAEISGGMCSLEAAYVSFQFQEVKHPNLPKAFGSTILIFVQPQNVSKVIRTICVLTSRIEDKEVWDT